MKSYEDFFKKCWPRLIDREVTDEREINNAWLVHKLRNGFEPEPNATITFPLFVIDKKTNERHEVCKFIYDREKQIHIWCNSWYGHHVIGHDCEWENNINQFKDQSLAEFAKWVNDSIKISHSDKLVINLFLAEYKKSNKEANEC